MVLSFIVITSLVSGRPKRKPQFMRDQCFTGIFEKLNCVIERARFKGLQSDKFARTRNIGPIAYLSITRRRKLFIFSDYFVIDQIVIRRCRLLNCSSSVSQFCSAQSSCRLRLDIFVSCVEYLTVEVRGFQLFYIRVQYLNVCLSINCSNWLCEVLHNILVWSLLQTLDS